MMILLDTHVLLWALVEPAKLSEKEREILENTENEIFVSAASIWEIAIKLAIKKLQAPLDLQTVLSKLGFKILPIDFETAWRVKDLPFHHNDPFDRLIIATGQQHHLTILTHDPLFQLYDHHA
jgi:PIN domain nuclease of toxin-antitoxin system